MSALEILMGSIFILGGILDIANIDNIFPFYIIITLFAASLVPIFFMFTTMYFSWPRRFLIPEVRDLEPEWVLPWSRWAREQQRIQQHESDSRPTQEDS